MHKNKIGWTIIECMVALTLSLMLFTVCENMLMQFYRWMRHYYFIRMDEMNMMKAFHFFETLHPVHPEWKGDRLEMPNLQLQLKLSERLYRSPFGSPEHALLLKRKQGRWQALVMGVNRWDVQLSTSSPKIVNITLHFSEFSIDYVLS